MGKRGPTQALRDEAEALWLALADRPMTFDEIKGMFGWSSVQTTYRITVLRDFICPTHLSAVTRPTAEDGYLYHLIDSNHPDGPILTARTHVAINDAATRLRSIARIAAIGMDVLPKGDVYYDIAAIMEAHVSAAIKQIDLVNGLSR